MKPPEEQSQAELLGIDLEELRRERFASAEHGLLIAEHRERLEAWRKQSEALNAWLEYRSDLD